MNKGYSRREFERIKFTEPIKTSIELVTQSFSYDLKIDSVYEVLVIDASAGGMRFLSKVDFPVNFIAIYKTYLPIKNRTLLLYGKIIRKRALINNSYEYGMQFTFKGL